MERITLSEFEAFKFGHTQNENAATGCSVIICEQGAVCGIDVRGGSPGTRDTDALNPIFNRKVVHAVLLTGGSTFGLDAAGGVMKFLEERKIGRDVGVTTVPNVCAAVLFDLKCVDHKIRPDEKMGYESCQNAYLNSPFLSGSVGAGTGATIGKINGPAYAMKGGIGTCAFRFGDLMVAAVVAVNAVGDVTDHEKIIAGALNKTKTGFIDSEKVILERYQDFKDFFSGNTVIGCVVTNGKLTKNQATKLASVAQNGIARCIRPAHTIFDGDTIFVMSHGEVSATLDAIGVLATRAVEVAIKDAIIQARSLGGYPAFNDIKSIIPKE